MSAAGSSTGFRNRNGDRLDHLDRQQDDQEGDDVEADHGAEAQVLGPSARYGYGIIADSLDGREVLWHGGGMLGKGRSSLSGPVGEGG